MRNVTSSSVSATSTGPSRSRAGEEHRPVVLERDHGVHELLTLGERAEVTPSTIWARWKAHALEQADTPKPSISHGSVTLEQIDGERR